MTRPHQPDDRHYLTCVDRTRRDASTDEHESPKQRIQRRQGLLGRDTDAAACWLPILGCWRAARGVSGAVDAFHYDNAYLIRMRPEVQVLPGPPSGL
jgi:hypothetical protein